MGGGGGGLNVTPCISCIIVGKAWEEVHQFIQLSLVSVKHCGGYINLHETLLHCSHLKTGCYLLVLPAWWLLI